MKKIETSKLILCVDFVVAVILSAIVVTGAFMERDMAYVATIAAGWDAQLGVATGFYYWKAKNENRAKGTQQLIQTMAEKYGIEAVAQIAELIYKE